MGIINKEAIAAKFAPFQDYPKTRFSNSSTSSNVGSDGWAPILVAEREATLQARERAASMGRPVTRAAPKAPLNASPAAVVSRGFDFLGWDEEFLVAVRPVDALGTEGDNGLFGAHVEQLLCRGAGGLGVRDLDSGNLGRLGLVGGDVIDVFEEFSLQWGGGGRVEDDG